MTMIRSASSCIVLVILLGGCPRPPGTDADNDDFSPSESMAKGLSAIGALPAGRVALTDLRSCFVDGRESDLAVGKMSIVWAPEGLVIPETDADAVFFRSRGLLLPSPDVLGGLGRVRLELDGHELACPTAGIDLPLFSNRIAWSRVIDALPEAEATKILQDAYDQAGRPQPVMIPEEGLAQTLFPQ